MLLRWLLLLHIGLAFQGLSRISRIVMSFPSPIERLEQLSALVSEKTQLLTDFLSTKGRNAPSLSADELAEFPISPDDSEPFKARMVLIEATRELHDIVLGPRESLRALAWGVSLGSCLCSCSCSI